MCGSFAVGACVPHTRVLQSNHSLIDLRLDDNRADVDAAVELSHSLAENQTLVRLSLSNNCILSDGAAAIATLLKKNQVLAYVNVRENYIGEEGRSLLVAAVTGQQVAVSDPGQNAARILASETDDAADLEVPKALRHLIGQESKGIDITADAPSDAGADDTAVAVVDATEWDLTAAELVITNPVTGVTVLV